MPTFNLIMTRTETHTISDTLDAETLEDAIDLMHLNECDGAYDSANRNQWRYEHGQINDVNLVDNEGVYSD